VARGRESASMRAKLTEAGPIACLVPLTLCAALSAACVLVLALPGGGGHAVDPRLLLADVSWFPTGTRVWQGPEAIPLELDFQSESNSSISFLPPQAPVLASHNVFRFRNAAIAILMYRSITGVEYRDFDTLEGWNVPLQWDYKSAIADQFEFRCARSAALPSPSPPSPLVQCSAVARYGDFVSVFSSPVIPGAVSLSDVQNILQMIDARMAEYLK
jgi:hypothetical protein